MSIKYKSFKKKKLRTNVIKSPILAGFKLAKATSDSSKV